MKNLASAAFLLLFLNGAAFACSAQYNITLETFGEGVLVELRSGSPGKSKVVRSARSTGGNVNFSGLCQGNYFLAIGNSESVSVTPVRFVQDGAVYTSRIATQRGSGNVSKQSRSGL